MPIDDVDEFWVDLDSGDGTLMVPQRVVGGRSVFPPGPLPLRMLFISVFRGECADISFRCGMFPRAINWWWIKGTAFSVPAAAVADADAEEEEECCCCCCSLASSAASAAAAASSSSSASPASGAAQNDRRESGSERDRRWPRRRVTAAMLIWALALTLRCTSGEPLPTSGGDLLSRAAAVVDVVVAAAAVVAVVALGGELVQLQLELPLAVSSRIRLRLSCGESGPGLDHAAPADAALDRVRFDLRCLVAPPPPPLLLLLPPPPPPSSAKVACEVLDDDDDDDDDADGKSSLASWLLLVLLVLPAAAPETDSSPNVSSRASAAAAFSLDTVLMAVPASVVASAFITNISVRSKRCLRLCGGSCLLALRRRPAASAIPAIVRQWLLVGGGRVGLV